MSEARHESAFSAPLGALVLPLLILGFAGLEFLQPEAARQGLRDILGLNPILVRAGHFELLFTYPFLHSSFMAAAINAILTLAFSVPVLRALKRGVTGFASYLSLVLLCVVAAGLAFCLVYPRQNETIVGASVIMSGLLGAAVRFPNFQTTTGALNSFFSLPVVGMTAAWCTYHLIVGMLQYYSGGAGGQMAWESHLSAYFIGLCLIGPWLRVFNPDYFTTK